MDAARADLGFRLIRGAARAAATRPRFRIAPAWGLAAAALLVLAVGAAIANLDVRYGGRSFGTHRVAARRRCRRPRRRTLPAASRTSTGKRRRRYSIGGFAISSVPSGLVRRSAVQNASATDLSDAEIQRVREIVGQSETRQQRMVTARLAELMHDFDTQRRIDLASHRSGHDAPPERERR